MNENVTWNIPSEEKPICHRMTDATKHGTSDNEIAKRCKVSHTYVGKIRKVTCNVSSDNKKYLTKQGSESVMNTQNIGKSLETVVSVDSTQHG